MPKKFEELFEDLDYELVPATGVKDAVTGISYNSKATRPGNIFFGLQGFNTDGRAFIDEAVKNGARIVVTDQGFSQDLPVAVVKVKNPRKVLGIVARRFFDNPAKSLTIVGITGTNGKTTTSFLIRSILEKAGIKAGLIGTIFYYLGKRELKAKNTTPESLDLCMLLTEMKDAGLTHVVMEVSSHALAMSRVDEIPFQIGVFTNLTRDHLDFHGTFEDYRNTKLKLFGLLKENGTIVYNLDDPLRTDIEKLGRKKMFGYGINNHIEGNSRREIIQARIDSISSTSTRFTLRYQTESYTVSSPLLGRHNVYNLMAAFGVGVALNIEQPIIIEGLTAVDSVPGRLMPVANKKELSVFVDYAHTDDALKNVLSATREFTHGKIIVVFGCGGNRDRGKRPLMGRVATELADFAIITSDNPRNEDPQSIVDDITKGIHKDNYRIILDRQEAICAAIAMARQGDSVIIAGKGHETDQILHGATKPFDDFKVAQKCLD